MLVCDCNPNYSGSGDRKVIVPSGQKHKTLSKKKNKKQTKANCLV
jgi:hypothetical protein